MNSLAPSSLRVRAALALVCLGACLLPISASAAPAIQYSHGDPTNQEQYTLELINRARMGPPQEGIFLTTQTDPTINQGYAFFNVNKPLVQTSFVAIQAMPPLAFNSILIGTARSQTIDQQTFNYQGHSRANPLVFEGQRIVDAGYFGVIGENVYAFVPGLLFGHVGFNIDWGVPGLEHRKAIMGIPPFDTMREMGIGIVQNPSNAPQHPNEFFITQDFGERYAVSPFGPTNIPFLVGVVYTDTDADGFYTPGEGAAGVTVMPNVGDNYAVTSASGGYAIPLQNLPQGTTSITVTFSGGALGTRQVARTIALNGNKNLKSDVVVQADTATRLINLSTRLRVETGGNVGIGGFVVTGTVPKQILVRALGPSLVPFGVSGALSNPTLQIFNSGGVMIAQNDNWQTPVPVDPMFPPASAAQITATGFPPASANECAVLLTLSPGAYTGIVSGVGGEMGIALIEVYDVSLGVAGARAINVSTRGRVLTNDAVMIGGFVIQGNRPRRVIIRALGPSLTTFGVPGALMDPWFQVVNGSGAPIAQNDNWKSGPSMAELQSLGRAPSDDRDAAQILTLAPGAYTVIVRGVADTTGVALVEVYDAEE
ncbi:hypothetical protein AYO41_04480 [Verrucomicrobia bacterium SCGC AG-212-E04]|nr:hypothetical protein AYO41_04480 [Verrucomicrobia bacterium SCGC AG-212-E04]